MRQKLKPGVLGRRRHAQQRGYREAPTLGPAKGRTRPEDMGRRDCGPSLVGRAGGNVPTGGHTTGRYGRVFAVPDGKLRAQTLRTHARDSSAAGNGIGPGGGGRVVASEIYFARLRARTTPSWVLPDFPAGALGVAGEAIPRVRSASPRLRHSTRAAAARRLPAARRYRQARLRIPSGRVPTRRREL
jgi:hypothetical protein